MGSAAGGGAGVSARACSIAVGIAARFRRPLGWSEFVDNRKISGIGAESVEVADQTAISCDAFVACGVFEATPGFCGGLTAL
jgi:hypothetical protein